MSRRATAYAALTAGLLLAAIPASAYRMIQNTAVGRVTAGNAVTCSDPGGFAHWNTQTIDWRHNTGGAGWDKAAALQAAMAEWNTVPGSNYVLNYAGQTTNGWATDGVNTLLWANGNGCEAAQGCLALTALVLQAGQVIVESDVTFNTDYAWAIDGSDHDTEAVAVHELGHSLGIHHTNVVSGAAPSMRATYFGVGGRSLETDDEEALRCSQETHFGCANQPGCEDDCIGEWYNCWDPGREAYCDAQYDACMDICNCT